MNPCKRNMLQQPTYPWRPSFITRVWMLDHAWRRPSQARQKTGGTNHCREPGTSEFSDRILDYGRIAA
jgi:hypothetical protein